MKPIRIRLRMALGGAVCGSFLGLFAGGLLGGLYGAFASNVALGLDVALLGGGVGLLGGAGYGGYLAIMDGRAGTPAEPVAHEVNVQRHDDDGRAAPGVQDAAPPPPRQHSI